MYIATIIVFPTHSKEVASTILSDVNVTESIYRHKGSDTPHVGYSNVTATGSKSGSVI